MNFQQLRIVRETVRRQFNLTDAAASLNTSQSGVSKHIKDLEDELGFEIFVRKGKRLLGLTDPGVEVAAIVDRMLTDAASIKKLGEQYADRDEGRLTIATTHAQARYALTQVVQQFRQLFPKVHLALVQGRPAEIAEMVVNGDAEIAIATETLSQNAQLAAFPFYQWTHGVLVPRDHELTHVKPLTLQAVSEHPIITYQEGFTGRGNIDASFAALGLTPDIVMTAMDTDVLKTYVALGLGVGIVAAMSYSRSRDPDLVLIEEPSLFPTNTSWIAVRRGAFLRQYAYRFIELCTPAHDAKTVKANAGTG